MASGMVGHLQIKRQTTVSCISNYKIGNALSLKSLRGLKITHSLTSNTALVHGCHEMLYLGQELEQIGDTKLVLTRMKGACCLGYPS